MKITNKLLSLILAAVMTAGLVCGCAGLFSSEFSIVGSWKNVGSDTWGQIRRKNQVLTFTDTSCNLFSPSDTYAFSKDGSTYTLWVRGLLGGETEWEVTIHSNNRISLTHNNTTLEFERVK